MCVLAGDFLLARAALELSLLESSVVVRADAEGREDRAPLLWTVLVAPGSMSAPGERCATTVPKFAFHSA